MREAREQSTNLNSYFGKVVAAQHKMPLKHISLQNLYAQNEDVFQGCIDPDKIESCTMISSIGGDDSTADMAFMDYTWRCQPPKPKLKR